MKPFELDRVPAEIKPFKVEKKTVENAGKDGDAISVVKIQLDMTYKIRDDDKEAWSAVDNLFFGAKKTAQTVAGDEDHIGETRTLKGKLPDATVKVFVGEASKPIVETYNAQHQKSVVFTVNKDGSAFIKRSLKVSIPSDMIDDLIAIVGNDVFVTEAPTQLKLALAKDAA